MPAMFASQFSLRSIQPKAQLSTARIHKLTEKSVMFEQVRITAFDHIGKFVTWCST